MKECKKCRHCYEDELTLCPNDGQALISPFGGSAVLDNKYLLEQRLGTGGMGAVYRARHVVLQKAFAVKLIKPQETQDVNFLSRFRIEAEALGKLNHPHIVQVTDYGIDPRTERIPYLVMEYLEGYSLTEKIRRSSLQKFEEILPMLNSIAQALDYAHTCGILHRDLKPDNVFLVQNAVTNSITIKVFDFGLARFLDHQGPLPQRLSDQHDIVSLRPTDEATQCIQSHQETSAGTFPNEADAETHEVVVDPQKTIESTAVKADITAARLTMPGTFMGTPMYMAPEIIKLQDATKASDIYSFGILIYETLVGHPLFSGSFEKVMNLHLNENPPIPSSRNSHLPEELNQAILAPLQKDPSSRPPTAQEVVKQINEAYYHSQIRQWKAIEIPKRIRISIVLALLAIIMLWIISAVPSLRLLEEKLIDARFYLTSVHSPDPNMILLSLDDSTLAVEPTPLTQKADEMGTILQDVFDAGARGVAIDLLLPAQWSHSQAFSKFILKHPNQIVLAALSTQDGKVVGPEALDSLTTVALGPDKIAMLFGFVNMEADADGIIRKVPLTFKDKDSKTRNSFALQFVKNIGDSTIARLNQKRLSIDYSIDWHQMQKLSWKDVASLLKQKPELFSNKYVVVGGEFAGSGDEFYRIPHPKGVSGEASGLVIQSIIINSLLQDRHIQSISESWSAIILAVCIASAAFLLLYSKKLFPLTVLVSSIGILYIVASFLIFHSGRWLLPISAPFISYVLAIIAALWVRNKLPCHPGPPILLVPLFLLVLLFM